MVEAGPVGRWWRTQEWWLTWLLLVLVSGCTAADWRCREELALVARAAFMFSGVPASERRAVDHDDWEKTPAQAGYCPD